MKKKMKGVLFATLLAVAGLFGVSSTLIDKQINETPVMEKADAAIPTYNCIAGDFNGWNAGDRMSDSTDSNFVYRKNVTIGSGKSFKLTNGSWSSSIGWGTTIHNESSATFSDGGGGNIQCNNNTALDIAYNGSDIYIWNAGGISASPGWVVAGSFSTPNWSPGTAIALGSGTSGNVAEKTNVDMTSGVQFRICYSDGYQLRDWKNWGSTPDGFTKVGDNLVLTNSGKVDVFLNSSYVGYASYHFPQYTVTASVSPSGYGTVSQSTISNVNSGTTYSLSGNNLVVGETTITPTPHADADGYTYSFTGWTKGGSAVTSGTIIGDTTFVANFSRALKHYTIKYDRNKNDSTPQVDQDKTHGTNVNALIPGTSTGMTGAAWNPSFGKKFTHWNTAYDDSGDTIDSGASISSNASFWLYYIEDWFEFRYKVNSGSWITLVHNDEGKGDGVKAQFAPASAQDLPLHGKISFQYNDGSSWNDLTGVSFEGNYDTTEGIELATFDTIYLKIYDNNSYGCWVPGISDRTVAVCASADASSGVAYTMRGNGPDETVTTAEVYIEKGQFVKRGYLGNYLIGTWFAGGTGNANDCFRNVGTTDANTAAECLVTGVYTIYNQRGTYDFKDLWFVRNEEASAKALAQQFNSIISSLCTAVSGGTKGLSDLQAAWGSNSSSTLYKHFNGQFTETMAFFTAATPTDDDILECVTRYDYIENKYGTTALPNFLGRTKSYKTAIQSFGPFNLINGEDGGDNATTIIIIIASSVSLLSITALSVLLVKKRKNKEQ